MRKIIFSALAFTTLMQAAPLGLKTQAELGFIKNTGNTVDETFTLDVNLNKEWEKHIANVKITAQYGTQNNVETKNKFLSELSYDYKFTEIFAFNYLFGYKLDAFSTFDSQLYTGPGLKYIVLTSETQNLNLAVNVLYSQDNSNVAGVKTQDYTACRLALGYDWQILENLKFTQELNYRSDIEDSENYFIYSKSGVSTKISDYFSAGISYIVDYVNMENLGSKNADKTITANLIINY